MLDALAAGAPVEPLARYFEYWLLRLQGVYPEARGSAVGRGAGVSGRVAHGAAARRSAACRSTARVLRELESVHRALIAMHLEKTLKSDRVLRDLRRHAERRCVTFQDLILKLSAFWASHGCLLQQPLDLEVGAGTSHPETLFRVLGPEAVERGLRAAVAAARRRPVRTEPEPPVQAPPVPGDPQAVARRSAAALSRQPRSRAASTRGSTTSGSKKTTGSRRRSARGASAGRCCSTALEITQFTYFQQVGGIDLAPISCEITYGLERIAMFLQRVDNVFDLEWGGGVKYGEVRLQEEIEQSKYAFGQVDMPPRGVRGAASRPVRQELRVRREAARRRA